MMPTPYAKKFGVQFHTPQICMNTVELSSMGLGLYFTFNMYSRLAFLKPSRIANNAHSSRA
ncbi:hypothetical protein HOLleu_08866 [Holothuria leucospilota]|uniref:Uncharacterized protein n=1 Tax=Holothuria leucospilota TaxID=206669 RepID=A0A9Q1CI89_HOLLE|nr:hypothetical protein HOLleu_08866 [Holothuria leucospilota]